MEDEEDSMPPPPSEDAPLCYLRMVFKDARDVFADAMKTEVAKKYERVSRDLGGFMYLSPNKMPDFNAHDECQRVGERICKPDRQHVNMWIKVKIQEGYSPISLSLSMRRYGEVWKLKDSITLSYAWLRITVKKAGSDEWTPVQLFLDESPQTGTDFQHGDQLDVRYVHNEQDEHTHPVSLDGTERTNYFPVTIVVI